MTFTSVHEILNPLTQERRQRLWEWFDGDALGSRWTTRDITGTGTFAMNTEVNGGFRITTGTNSSDSSSIWFNDINHYSHLTAVIIWVSRRVGATTFSAVGLTDDVFDVSSNQTNIQDDTGDTNKTFVTASGTATSSSTGVAINTNFTSYKITAGSSVYTAFVDGIQRVTNSTDKPTGKMQPNANCFARSTGGKSIDVRYYEAFNK